MFTTSNFCTMWCMRSAAILATAFAFLSVNDVVRADDAPQKAATSDEEAAIRAGSEKFAKDFAAGDAKAIAAGFAKDGELIDEYGRTFRGREAIEKEYAEIFANRPGAKIDVKVDSIKFLGPNVAVESGTAKADSKTGAAGPATQYTAILVKQDDGKWLLMNVNESRPAVVSDAQRLASLSFLIGEWQADLGDGKAYQLRCEWMQGQSFIKRTFNVRENGQELSSGTQIIGFDPLAAQIVSWTFDSTGGFGHEMWENEGNRWRVNASSILPDGSTSLSTNYLTLGDNNQFTWQSVERSLNTQLLPDTALVQVKRVSE